MNRSRGIRCCQSPSVSLERCNRKGRALARMALTMDRPSSVTSSSTTAGAASIVDPPTERIISRTRFAAPACATVKIAPPAVELRSGWRDSERDDGRHRRRRERDGAAKRAWSFFFAPGQIGRQLFPEIQGKTYGLCSSMGLACRCRGNSKPR